MSPASAALERFYAAESAYMAAEDAPFAPVAATLHPECVILEPAALPYGGEWRGHTGWELWMRSFRATWSSLSVKGAQVFDTGDAAVLFSRSHVRAVARATGRRADWPLLQQVTVRDGLLAG